MKKKRRIEKSSDTLPYKPTREAATASRTAAVALGQRDIPAGANAPEELGRERHEIHSGEPRELPHTTPQDRDVGDRKRISKSADAPVLPANASGFDAVDVETQNEPIDPESMYDRRPERDKNRPPSRRARDRTGRRKSPSD